MEDIQTRFSVENWNNEIGKVFEECYKVLEGKGQVIKDSRK